LEAKIKLRTLVHIDNSFARYSRLVIDQISVTIVILDYFISYKSLLKFDVAVCFDLFSIINFERM